MHMAKDNDLRATQSDDAMLHHLSSLVSYLVDLYSGSYVMYMDDSP